MNNPKILGFILAISLLLVANVSAEGFSDIIKEGDQNNYTLNGGSYNVKVIIYEDMPTTAVQFEINGELTDYIYKDDYSLIGEGGMIGVLDIFDNSVEFFLQTFNYEFLLDDIRFGGEDYSVSNPKHVDESKRDIFDIKEVTITNPFLFKDIEISKLIVADSFIRDVYPFYNFSKEDLDLTIDVPNKSVVVPANKTVSVPIKIRIPQNLDAVFLDGSELEFNVAFVTIGENKSIGTPFMSGAYIKMQRKNQLNINKIEAIINNHSTQDIYDRSTIHDLKPGDTISLEVEIKNNFSQDENLSINSIGVIKEIVIDNETRNFECSGVESKIPFEIQTDKIILNPNESKKIKVNLSIKEDENLICKLVVTGRDENGALHGDRVSFNLELNSWPGHYTPSYYPFDSYPFPYYYGQSDNIGVVVGSNAPASDVLTLVDIITKLQTGSWEEIGEGEWINLNNTLNNYGSSFNNAFREVNSFLDTELNNPDQIQNYNLIVVGHPCENPLVDALSSYKCDISGDGKKSIKGLDKGVAVIEAVENGPNSALIITGQDPEDRRKAGRLLSDFDNAKYNKVFYHPDKDPSGSSSLIGGVTKIFVTGTIEDPQIEQVVDKIDGLDESTTIFFLNWGETAPVGELIKKDYNGYSLPAIRAPSLSEMGKQFEFFQIDIYHTLPENQTFDVHFNLPKASFGSVSLSNVRLYVYEEDLDSWKELPTTLLDESVGIVRFKATTPHFSNFVVAETLPVPEPQSSSGSSGGGGGGGGGGSRRIPVIKEEAIQVPLSLPPRECAPGYAFDEREQCVLLSEPVQEPISMIQEKIKTETKQNNVLTGFSVLGDYVKSKEGIIMIAGSLVSLLLLCYLYSKMWYIRFRLKLFYIRIKYLF